MNANQSPNSIPSQAEHATGRCKTAGSAAAGSTVVFKRGFNLNRLSAQDRQAARELLQRLMSPVSLRPQV